jgi:hypothetical protein
MHLEGPWLSTIGKKKGKQKFRNAQEAKTARELDESWNSLQKQWGIEKESRARSRAATAEVWKPAPNSYRGANDPKIPSLNTVGGNAILAPQKIYTGTKVKGIATMHKSNAVPVFSDEEAIDISKMRR